VGKFVENIGRVWEYYSMHVDAIDLGFSK